MTCCWSVSPVPRDNEDGGGSEADLYCNNEREIIMCQHIITDTLFLLRNHIADEVHVYSISRAFIESNLGDVADDGAGEGVRDNRSAVRASK